MEALAFSLPQEMLNEIFSYVDNETLIRLSVCSRNFRDLATYFFLNRLHYLPCSQRVTSIKRVSFLTQTTRLQKRKRIEEKVKLSALLCSFNEYQFVFLGTAVDGHFYNCHPKLKILNIDTIGDNNNLRDYTRFKIDEIIGATIDKYRVSIFSSTHNFISEHKIEMKLFPVPEILQEKKLLAPFTENVIAIDSEIRLMSLFRILDKNSFSRVQENKDTDYKREDLVTRFPLF